MMTTEIKKLNEKRGLVKASLTRIKNKVDQFSEGSDNINQLKTRLPHLRNAFSEFSLIQNELELIDKENAQKHCQDREEFEDKYYDTESKLLTLIDRYNNRTSNNESATASASIMTEEHTGIRSVSNVRLPQLNLPVFEGNYSHWTAFYDTFRALIHDSTVYSNIEKFHYLRSCLKGDAFKTIEAVTISEMNYYTAWEILKRRFENTRLIVQEHVFKIINSPIIQRASHLDMRKLLDDISINLESLKSLGQPVEQWHAIIIPIVVVKFDYQTRREWESKLNCELPKVDELIEFLQKKCLLLESLEATNIQNRQVRGSQINKNNSYKKPTATSCLSLKTNFHCALCSREHGIYKCKELLKLSISDRVNKINTLKLCLNCFRANHIVANCNSSYSCRICNEKHNTLLHPTTASSSITNHTHNNSQFNNQVVLSTAEVLIKGENGEWIKIRALLDAGSQSNLITRDICEKLNLQLRPVNVSVYGINNASSKSNYSVEVEFKSQYNSIVYDISCLVMPELTNLPTTSFNKADLHIPPNINIADTNFDKTDKIDILLGAGIFWTLLRSGRQSASENNLHFQETALGWVAGGQMPAKQPCNKTRCHLNTLEAQIARFWEIEDCKDTRNLSKYSVEEQQCIDYFKATYKRDTEGRFIVRLPFKDNLTELGSSKHIAIQRFYNLERKFNRDEVLKLNYNKFVDEYLSLNHMQLVNEESVQEIGNYLPHHCVHKEASSTTKLRVVFDASTRTDTGISLNDTLMVGPKLQEDLFSIMIRFRTYQYVMTADINKMYRQILIWPEDRKYQRIVWRNDNSGKLNSYQLNTVTYGTNCAPYLAVQCLHQLATEESKHFPVAAKILKRDFYMDDLITGTNNYEDAIKLRNDLQQLLSRGGFQLRKWATNNISLLPEDHNIEHMINFDDGGRTKLLGLWWNYNLDTLNFVINPAIIDTNAALTKRSILSKIAQVFDPLGLLTPIIISAKLIIQQLWQLQHDWDTPVPCNLQNKWTNLAEQLKDINTLQFPRKTIKLYPANNIQVHGFSDASEKAYGACVYIRSVDAHGQIHVQLMCSKSRVSPLKTLTIPRLELCAAVLLSRLMNAVITAINIEVHDIAYWTDSEIVLAWQASPPHKLKTFIANRVVQIQTLTDTGKWRHVRSADNPADLISRGCTPEKLIQNTLWFHGPEWLGKNEAMWPISKSNIQIEQLPEIRTVSLACKTVMPNIDWMFNYSNFSKLRRVTAYCLRFIFNCNPRNKTVRKSESLSVAELEGAEISIVKSIQRSCFAQEWHDLNRNRKTSNKSKLTSLNPFIGVDGLIRVGGRLRHANIEYSKKHPIVLPKHDITKLIIKFTHEAQLHAGLTATLAAIREVYWPLAGRSQVRQVVHKCIPCFRAKPKFISPITGDLPASRLKPVRPFSNCGVDYAGPILIREGTGRGKRKVKAYICVFVCFVTKAMHLELVHTLTAEAFLNALKRFIGRRGMIENIYSDNATNFIGAARELQSLSELFNSQQFKDRVVNRLSEDKISWHFIPPRSPNFGGVWEASVKRVKFHLTRILGNALLTYEEMYTILVCIEACLNSRPLCPLSNDPNDLAALTPGHFLIGCSLTAPNEPSLLQLRQNRLSRYQHIERVRQHFWSRWSKEYLANLQPRPTSSTDDTAHIKPGVLVLIKEPNTPPLAWRYGRILEIHPGEDGVVRVVSVKTAQGVFKRAVRNISVVPLSDSDDQT